MRTITGTDYTITYPEYYCFVFNPNTILFEFGSTFTEPQKVTISANGITQSRYTIAGKCKFDMSVIFESYFSDKTFPINYASNTADPFFQTDFDLTVFIDGVDEYTLAFSLRWGCYQFDDVQSNDDYTFPYWVGYPLVINSDKEHDTSVISGTLYDDGTFTGVQTTAITNFPESQFTHQVELSETKVQKITYEPQSCSTGNYLQWVDQHGMIRHFMFYANREKQIAKEIKAGNSIQYYPESLDDSNFGRSKVIEKTKQRSFGCFQSIEETIYPIVESILSTPIVKYWTNSKWIEVKIKDATIEPMKRGYVDIEFSVELPKDFNQRR
jgi:hypothetical protein